MINNLSPEKLAKLEQDAMSVLLRGTKRQEYILIKPEDVIDMIIEIKELRKLADQQALTAAYTLGLQSSNYVDSIQAEKWNGILPQTMIPNQSIPVIAK